MCRVTCACRYGEDREPKEPKEADDDGGAWDDDEVLQQMLGAGAEGIAAAINRLDAGVSAALLVPLSPASSAAAAVPLSALPSLLEADDDALLAA